MVTEGDGEYQTIVVAAPLHDIGKLIHGAKSCVLMNASTPDSRLNDLHALLLDWSKANRVRDAGCVWDVSAFK